ncbi:MAG TPA: hypothetical protein HPP56_08960, partial [Nitrospirae bacterium]|nr:hypothetical protein [Nitrospirota bacterium]
MQYKIPKKERNMKRREFLRDASMAGVGFWAMSKGLDKLITNAEATTAFEM